jgi:chemotaxis protein CheD
MIKEINVHIGEVKTARRGEILKAILGSCVGIGFIWREANVCGLAHCLLPEAPERTFIIGARFVDQAIPSLVAMMRIKPGDFKKIEAVVAGGGNMTAPQSSDDGELVGGRNTEVALRLIEAAGLRLLYSEVGGEQGRCIKIDSNDFSYSVRAIPRIVRIV